jgi:hypothetical protein
MDTQNWVFGVAVIAATFLGPIVAVGITLWAQARSEKRGRRLTVFRELMAHRRVQLSENFVRGVNLTEIEFHGEQKVINALREFMEILSENTSSHDEAQFRSWNERVEDKKTQLLYNMGVCLGYSIQQLEILRGGYYPIAHNWKSERDELVQRFLAEIASGTRALPIQAITNPNQNEEEAKLALFKLLTGDGVLRVSVERQQ